MDWFGEKKKTWSVILSGEIPGFKKPLTCIAQDGETIQVVLDRLNTYRGPDQQIARAWSNGVYISLSTPIRSNMMLTVS